MWRRPPARWIALAAVLAAVALVPLLRRGGSSPADAGRFAALLASRDAGLPDGWAEASPLSTTRGGAEVSADTARAVRLGILLLDLEVAVHARDRANTGQLAADILHDLQTVPGSGPLTPIYRDIQARAGAEPEELEDPLREGREGIAGYFDPGLVELGSWNEAARLAAARQDAGFFASRETRKVLGSLSDDPSLDPHARAALDRVRGALPSGGAADWPALRGALDVLMQALGR